MGDSDVVLSGRERLIYYSGRVPRKIREAKSTAKGVPSDPDTLDWSDEESDWLPKSPPKPEPKKYDSLLTDQPSTIHPDVKKDDHKRKGVGGVAGDVTVETRRMKPLLQREEKKANYDSFRIPMPYLPSHVRESLGQDIAEHMWHEFLEYGADESELVQCTKLTKIGYKMEKHLGFKLTFDLLRFNGLDRNDYVTFKEVCSQLAAIAERANTTVKPPKRAEPKIPLPHCAGDYCKLGDEGLAPVGEHRPHFHQMAEQEGQDKDASGDNKDGDEEEKKAEDDGSKSGGEDGDEDGEDDDEDSNNMDYYALNLAYQHLKAKLHGFVRLKHVPQLMENARMPYDKSRYPSKEWDLRGEFVLHHMKDLEKVATAIRTDHDEDIGADVDPLYALPKWMENEFKPSEIMLFKHHFMSIDADGGGEIDEEELMTLTESLGARVTMDEAKALIEVMDLDGGGTVSFDEFMMLMYKIQNNVIDLEGNLLAKSMMAAKSQLAIFEEIEDNMSNPTPGTKVLHYGGQPLVCDILIHGPEGSLYEGSNVQLRIVFHDGYPYRQPDVYFNTRMYHLNVLVQYDGQGSLPHLKYFWDSSWDIRKILSHVIELMVTPDINLVPVEYISIVKVFLKERLEASQTADNERRAQILFEKQEAREAEEARLAAIAAQEEEDREEEERRQGEVRIMSGEDEICDNLVEIEEMEKHDINTIEEDEKRHYRLMEYKADWDRRLDEMTELEKQDLAELIDANEEPDWEEQERVRVEKEEKRRAWEEALALCLWEIDNAKYEIHMMKVEDTLSEDVRDEEHTMAGTDPLLMLLRSLIGAEDTGTGDATSDELMEKIGRVEQMHLTTIQMFMFERERYEGVVTMYRERFGKTFDPEDDEGVEGEGDVSVPDSKADSKSAVEDKGGVEKDEEEDQYAAEKAQAKEDLLLDAKGDDLSGSEESDDGDGGGGFDND